VGVVEKKILQDLTLFFWSSTCHVSQAHLRQEKLGSPRYRVAPEKISTARQEKSGAGQEERGRPKNLVGSKRHQHGSPRKK
jgi:hypothetical protein